MINCLALHHVDTEIYDIVTYDSRIDFCDHSINNDVKNAQARTFLKFDSKSYR